MSGSRLRSNMLARRQGLLLVAAVAASLVFNLGRLTAATLNGSFSPVSAGSNVNLSIAGKLDWVHWGLFTETSVNRKSCGNVLIGDFWPVWDPNNPLAYTHVYQYADNANGYTWSDGHPVLGVTNTPTGVWAYGTPNIGAGFEFSVPADSTPRTLQVFLGVFSGRGKFEAHLSDGSAPGYTNSALANLAGNGAGGVYTLNYSANLPGQSLTIRWTLSLATDPAANVTLQAATLTASGVDNPPFALLTNPVRNATFSEPADLTLNATAQDFDGSVTNVSFYSGATKLGEQTTAPYSLIWSNVPRGLYLLSAVATDNLGQSSCGNPVEVFVYGSGGGQTNAMSAAPGTVDLTAEGTADWAHWGLPASTNFNHKSTVPRQISDFTTVGSGAVQSYGDNYTAFSWSDGTPIAAASAVTTGVFATGLDNGFQLTAPADGNLRQLRVYVGGYGFQGELQAWLGDLSAPPFIDTSVSNNFGNSYLVYTFNYRAASAGQQLNVVWRSSHLFDQAYGNMTLQAATLEGQPFLAPFSITNAVWLGSDFIMSFNTQTGYTYTAQYAVSLPPPGWTNFATLPGNGALLTVTNSNVPLGRRFFRVQAQ